MAKIQISTATAPKPIGPYSQALRVGSFVYVSGQGPAIATTGEIPAETIEEQTQQTLMNISAILAAAGATLEDVIRCTVYLSDLAHFERYNRIYERHFGEPKPTRTTVGAQLLGILIEIDAIAYLGDKEADR